jgi:hypothetical protein
MSSNNGSLANVNNFKILEMSRLEEDVLKSPREKLACVINAIAIITSNVLMKTATAS